MRRWSGLALAVLLACGSSGEPPPAAVEPAAPAPPRDTVELSAQAREAAGVVTAAATLTTRDEGLEAPAVIGLDERKTARIGSVVDGIVVATRAEVGDRVGRGFTLAELHSQVVHEAWAAYRKAIAERRRATAELEFTRQAEARAGRLLRDQAIARQDAERARVDRLAAEEQLEVARTDVRRAEENLEHLGITSGEDPRGERGEMIPVRTPIAGVVMERLATTGTAVTTGTLLFVVSDLTTLWAVAEIDETAVGRITPGKAVTVRVASGESFPGTIGFIGDRVNPKTRRITVRCDVPNPQGRLKPDMFARVTLATGAVRQVVVVPSGAVQEVDGRSVVFVESAGGGFTIRPVRTGADAAGQVEILEGLESGERVAAQGTFLLKSELLRGRLGEEDAG